VPPGHGVNSQFFAYKIKQGHGMRLLTSLKQLHDSAQFLAHVNAMFHKLFYTKQCDLVKDNTSFFDK